MRRLLLILLIPLLASAVPAAAQADDSFLLGAGTRAKALAFGPDGNLWFTAVHHEGLTDLIGRATPTGEVREFPLPKREGTEIGGIVAGADGKLWFADTSRDAIGRAGLDGAVTELPLPRGSGPTGIVAGPDGAIWFTAAASDRLGRIDAAGSLRFFPLPLGANPLDLAFADGAFWIAENGRNAIARVTPDGAMTEYPLPHPDSKPRAIVRGADGNLWFSEEADSRIGRIDPAGAIVEFDVPGNFGGTGALAAAADGTIFFVTGSQRAGVEIGSLSPTGVLTGLGCVTAYCDLPVSALTVGPEGGLWYATDVRYTEGGGGGALLELHAPGTIGRFQPPGPVAVSIDRQALRVRKRHTRIGLSCSGGPEAICTGAVSLEAKVRAPGARRPSRAIFASRYFRLPAGGAHAFALKITPYGLNVLRRGPLRVTVRAAVHGGAEATSQLTLHPPRRH
jgi:virginiamycin B lyase